MSLLRSQWRSDGIGVIGWAELICDTVLNGWSNSLGNSQFRLLQRWKTVTRSSRLQSRNRPIFLFLSLSNFDLKLFTDFANTVTWSNIFQRLTTLSEKKWRRTSQLQRCLTSKWMTTGSIVSVQFSKNLVNGIDERFFAILKTSMRSERFLLSSRVHRFSLSRRSMCNCWLLSLAYYRIVTYTLTKCHGVLAHCHQELQQKSWKTARLFLQERDQDLMFKTKTNAMMHC